MHRRLGLRRAWPALLFLFPGLAAPSRAASSTGWGPTLQASWPALRQGPAGAVVRRLEALRLDFSNPALERRGLRFLQPVVRDIESRGLSLESFRGLPQPEQAAILQGALGAHAEAVEEQASKALRRSTARAVPPQHVDRAHDILIDAHPFLEDGRRAELLAALPELKRKREVFERWNRSRLWAQGVARRLLADAPAETSEPPAWSQGTQESGEEIAESPEDPLESRRGYINTLSAHIRAVSFYLLPKLEEDPAFSPADRARRRERAQAVLQGLSAEMRDAAQLDPGRLQDLWTELRPVLSWYKDCAEKDPELEAEEINTRKESADEFLVVLEDLIRIASPGPEAAP